MQYIQLQSQNSGIIPSPSLNSFNLFVDTMDDSLKIKNHDGTIYDSSKMLNITYLELVDGITGSTLTQGKFYVITDFKTCYDQPDFDSTRQSIITGNYKQSEVDPIIVFATSNGSISTDAYQPSYPNDKIQYDWSFGKTEVTNGLAFGRITERIDENNNRTDYDHRTILFKRYRNIKYNLTPIQKGTISSTPSSSTEMSLTGTSTNFTSFNVGDYIGLEETNYKSYEITNIVSDTEMYVTGLTVTYLSNVKIYTTFTQNYTNYYKNNISSIDYVENYTFDADYKQFNNFIGNNAITRNYNEEYFILSNNVFKNGDHLNNTFGNNCTNNTFNYYSYNNKIGDFFYNNMFYYFIGNIFGTNITNNVFNSSFMFNTIGNNFYSNYSNNGFYGNSITNEFYGNEFSNGDFENNEIFNQFYGNIIYHDFIQNKVKNRFVNNRIFSEFHNNNIGNGFIDNYLYSKFYDNQINEYFQENTIGDNGNLNNFSFYRNTIGNNFGGNNVRMDFQNNQINNNFQNNNINGSFYKNVIGNGFNSNQNIGNNFYSNHLVNSFNDNYSIGDEFHNNNIGENFSNNYISHDFHDNHIGSDFYNNTLGNTDFFSWDNTSIENLTGRTYDTLYNSLDSQIGNVIIGKELIMHDTVNNEYHKVKFTQWTQNGNGGGFSYERTKVYPTTEPTVYFTKTNYGSEVDIIVPESLEITRGNNGGIYNSAVQGGWNGNNPQGTEWNSIYTQPNNGSNFYNNKISNQFKGNLIYDNFYVNNVESYVFSNHFSGYTYGNVMGSYTSENDFYGDVYGNKWSGEFYNNQIGDSFSGNEFGFEIYNNTIGKNFQFNVTNTNIGSIDFTTNYGNITGFTYVSPGSTATDSLYIGLTTTTNGGGVNATFNIEVSGGVVIGVSGNTQGKLYVMSDTLTILGSQIGGTDGVDNITITVTALNQSPSVYESYSCNIFQRKGGDKRLSYYDENDILTITNINE